MTAAARRTIARRLEHLDWRRVAEALDAEGWSRLPRLMTAGECAAMARLYSRDDLFRSTIDMERYRFGRGQYRYFARPLPPLVDALRRELYRHLRPVATRWAERLQRSTPYPRTLAGFLALCREAKQTRPTPLLLRYGPGDYNRLHQDLYGRIAFPLQVLIGLSRPGHDYDGGEVVLLEQRPRAQSKAVALVVNQGDGLVFTNRDRPASGRRGFHAVQMRHGASTVTRGERLVLGIIFHDAEG
jgi:hypothetical protein